MTDYDGYNVAASKYFSTPVETRREQYGDAEGRFLELYKQFKTATGMTDQQALTVAKHHVRNEYGAVELDSLLQKLGGRR